ncbi:MAG: GMC family oxidoreductase [Gammaproteobacteria bacterium]|nr:GMC family oxidoreductase [Gammaproteobacteria bacterium]
MRHIQAEPDGGHIRQVDIASPAGFRGTVKARYFVLAAGGLENPRLLLDSSDIHPDGLGNDNDLVGRFFMEHPHARGGRVVTRQIWKLLKMFKKTRIGGVETTACLRPSDALQEQEGGLNSSLALACRPHPDARPSVSAQLYRAAKHKLSPSRHNRNLWLTVKQGSKQLQAVVDPLRPWLLTRLDRRGIYAVIRAEQAPDPASRVMLGSDTDALGMRRIRLDWHTGELDKHGARVAMKALDGELRRLKIGHVELAPWLQEAGNDWEFDPLISAHPIGGFHHMGTTRMADHPSRGVVDPHCRVFGLDNLYIAGSSVSPTGGWANPTLTLLALTLRLGEHLAGRLGRDTTPRTVQTDHRENTA